VRRPDTQPTPNSTNANAANTPAPSHRTFVSMIAPFDLFIVDMFDEQSVIRGRFPPEQMADRSELTNHPADVGRCGRCRQAR
jgi:hypothetical protein